MPRKEWIEKNLKRYLVDTAKRRAKEKEKPFDLSPEDIDLPVRCPILGIKLKKNDGAYKDDSYSVDCIVPKKGYVKGNVGVISWKANKIKGELSLKEVENLLNYMKKGE